MASEHGEHTRILAPERAIAGSEELGCCWDARCRSKRRAVAGLPLTRVSTRVAAHQQSTSHAASTRVVRVDRLGVLFEHLAAIVASTSTRCVRERARQMSPKTQSIPLLMTICKGFTPGAKA